MEIFTLPLGQLQTNCYILQNGENCLVIDPGADPERILDFTEGRGLTVEAILLTHGHFDHVGAVRELAAQTDCQVFLHEADLALPPTFTAGPLYYTHTYAEGDRLTLAGLTFDVLHTPGHTPGSVCLLFGDHLFAGDTLFARSCGRTDFPMGSTLSMEASLKRLSELDGNIQVYPGHGEETNICDEKRWNPFMK